MTKPKKLPPGIREHRGRYQVRYYGPDGKRRAASFGRVTDAKDFQATVRTDKRRNVWIDPKLAATRFDDFARQCLDSKLHLRPASRARDESLIKNHVIPAFERHPIGPITRPSVQHFVASLSAKGLAPGTVGECHRILYGVMADAVASRLIPENPCHRIKLPQKERRERRYLTPDELHRLANAIHSHFRALVLVGGYLGLRYEELAGLRRKDLDLLRKQLRIVATVERVGGSYQLVEQTKTTAARRTAAPVVSSKSSPVTSSTPRSRTSCSARPRAGCSTTTTSGGCGRPRSGRRASKA